MKKLLFIILAVSASLISGCAKKEGCTDKTATNYDASAQKDNGTCKFKKSYTVEYKVSCIGFDRTFTIYYITNGTTLSKVISGTQDWSTSFTASAGDYMSVKCTPPSKGASVSAVYLTINYNGTVLATSNAD